MVIDVTGTLIGLAVLAVGFQLSSIYTPRVTVDEPSSINDTTSHCSLYRYDHYYMTTRSTQPSTPPGYVN